MTEAEIINGCIHKNVKCQHYLFDQYSGILMSMCLRYGCDVPEAEDMLQESFIVIFRAISQYRFEGSFEGWIKKITLNTCLKFLRKKKILYSDSLDAENIIDNNEQVIADLSEGELIRLISLLPDGYRAVFNLYVIEGYSHNEIAEMLNIKTVTSRTQLNKARKLLQQRIISQQNKAVSHDR